jgi:hypothetical protein
MYSEKIPALSSSTNNSTMSLNEEHQVESFHVSQFHQEFENKENAD